MKLILLICLIGAAFAANAASPVCSAAATANKAEFQGVCQWNFRAGCSAIDEATGKCKTCGANQTVNSTTGDCDCASGSSIQADGTCVANGTTARTCPAVGYGKLGYNTNSDSLTCIKCDKVCKTCDQTITANDAAGGTANKCTATTGCHDSGAAISGTTCAAGTENTLAIWGVGWFKTCPPGYYAGTGECIACLPGCFACTDTTKCTACAPDHILDSTNRCKATVATAGDALACDATCAAQKCQTAKAKCTTCAADHTLSADQTCVRTKVKYCKEYDTADANKCKTCVDNAEVQAADGTCKCKPGFVAEFQAWAAKTGTATADTPYKNGCRACTDAEKTTLAECKTSTAPVLSTVSVTCTDTALTGKQCATCGADGKCTACINNSLKLADGGCDACADNYVRKTTTECAPVGDCKDTACTNNQKCGWNATTSKVECVTPAAETTAAATNGLLLSAISMVAALILA